MASLQWQGQTWLGTPRAIGDKVTVELFCTEDLLTANHDHWQLVAELMAVDCYCPKLMDYKARRN